MKKILALFLTAVLCLSCLTACGYSSEAKEVTCDEIIETYKASGCFVSYHSHTEDSTEYYCYIIIYESEDSTSDLVEITLYNTEEGAKEAAKNRKYNIAMWMFASMYGEFRWLKSGQYGKIVYSSYNSKLLKPIHSLMK